MGLNNVVTNRMAAFHIQRALENWPDWDKYLPHETYDAIMSKAPLIKASANGAATTQSMLKNYHAFVSKVMRRFQVL